MTRMFSFPHPDDADEPSRDERLGALLREVVGTTPLDDVDWTALADRVGGAVRAHGAPWWIHVERWQRRALPLALAAGLVGALAFWSSALASAESAALGGNADFVTAVLSGTSSAEAARSYAGSLTSTVELTAEVPE